MTTLNTPVTPVRLVETISPYFSRIEYPNGRKDTVSTRDLAPAVEGRLRHKLRMRRQQPEETVEKYMCELKLQARKCPTPSLTAAQHRDLLLTDAFVSGVKSPEIRQRLLESPSSSLSDLLNIAITMETAMGDSCSLTQTQSSSFPDPTVAAAKSFQPSTGGCGWCGKSPRHDRRACPARTSTCRKCGKNGHWASVCRAVTGTSKNAAIQQTQQGRDSSGEAAEDTNSLAVILATARKDNSNIVPVHLDGIATRALLDTGSDVSYVHEALLTDNRRCFAASNPTNITLADSSIAKTLGVYKGSLHLNGEEYCTTFTVVSSLVAPIIIGLDVLSTHSSVNLTFSGPRPPVTFKMCYVQTMKCKPYDIVPNVDTSKLKPLVAPKRRFVRHPEFIKKEVARLLEEGVIQESQSPWRAQCFVINYDTKPRLVFDYSETINKYTPTDSYPIPNIEDLLQKVSKYKVFSHIDLKSAYHQIKLNAKDYPLTAFEAFGRLFEFTRLCFGLTNAVAIFQRNMDAFIDENELEDTFAYLDDVLIGGYDQEHHDRNLAAFLEAAKKCNMTLNMEKCKFSLREISFLGYRIADGTLKPDPARFKALMEYPLPTSVKQLERLLGFFAYYAKWIPNSSELIQQISSDRPHLLKLGQLSENSKLVIDELKKLLSKAVLASTTPDAPLVIETDASARALGGTLSQRGRPVAFFSRVLSRSEQNQSVVEREASAIVECCRRWRHLLHAVPEFEIITDQKVVSFLFDMNSRNKIKNEKVLRWRLELSEYKYKINYRPGPLNDVCDALSRSAAVRDLGRLHILHSQLCHPGIARLCHYVKSKNMPYSVDDVRTVTQSCKICPEIKPKFFKPPQGQLVHATRPWERLSIDFVGPLPTNTSNRFLLVVVDEYSRYPFAFPCSTISAKEVVKHIQSLFELFGSPSSVHSDRGTQFESQEFKQFLLRHNVVKSRTTPYRPQANGQCERENGTIIRALKLALATHGLSKESWEQVLPTVLASTRALLCTATNQTPHERFLSFPRASITGIDIPAYLTTPGSMIYVRRRDALKLDTPVTPVRLVETISPYFSRIEYPNGRVDTVSTRDLAPAVEGTSSISDKAPYDEPQSPDLPEPQTFVAQAPQETRGDDNINGHRVDHQVSDVNLGVGDDARIQAPQCPEDVHETGNSTEPLFGSKSRKWTDVDVGNIMQCQRQRIKKVAYDA